MPDLDKETQKAAVKEALQEWMDKKYAEFGRWSMRGIIIMATVAVAYAYLGAHGWKP